MKKLVLASILALECMLALSQISISKKQGGSVITKLSMGIKVNDGSSLLRDQITINDAVCPMQLNDVGIETAYSSPNYSFRPTGNFTTKEPIVAYEIIHIVYNAFGEHIKTLSNTQITDIDGQKEFSKWSSWYATENNISEYLTCVSYVANVRTKKGIVWHYNFKALKEQLNKLEITFEEGFLPKKDNEGDRQK